MQSKSVLLWVQTKRTGFIQGLKKKPKQPLGCFSWAVKGEGVKRALRCIDLCYVDTVLSPLSRSTVTAWCDVAVTWTLRVLCVAPEARRLWKSSMMPLCWSASPNWTHAFILSCHSQMVSTAPTKLPIPRGIVKLGPEMGYKGCLEVLRSLLLHPGLPEVRWIRPSVFICQYF